MSDQMIEPIIHRIWAMPNAATFTIKPIKELIARYVPEGGYEWFDPFAGWNSPAQCTNDSNPDAPTAYHLDCVEFLQGLIRGLNMDANPTRLKGVLLDPPYTAHQTVQMYHGYGLDPKGEKRKTMSIVKDLSAELIQLGGYALNFGYNTNGMGINRGFVMVEILLVPHGGSHNDTIVTVERKVAEVTRE
jgi:hypothetical protein